MGYEPITTDATAAGGDPEIVAWHDGLVRGIRFETAGVVTIDLEQIYTHYRIGPKRLETWIGEAELRLTGVSSILAGVKFEDHYLWDARVDLGNGKTIEAVALLAGADISAATFEFIWGGSLVVECTHAILSKPTRVRRYRDWVED
jgi:hypothetical protein